ncbi:carboxypeptidase regulatory-like domain-containing protein [Candidatus Uhrbacteria bacterium]|nr:carboxypeptidase regulatory-like domain-containing protein [Candidatus Uhrbacteria bacterium]
MLRTSSRGVAASFVGASFVLSAILIMVRLDAASRSFVASFATTATRDAVTTAVWDTEAREIRLPASGAAWSPYAGLAEQRVRAIAFSPAFASDRTMLVGVADGIYRSTDAGASWVRSATTANEVVDIALSPAFTGDGAAFAITNGDGLWRSGDGGATWTKVDADASGLGVAFSPAFAADRTVFVAAFTSIRKSTDGGTSWSPANIGIDSTALENGDIRGIAVSGSYATDATVYVSALGIGVYRSVDGGANWSPSNPSGVSVSYAAAIATNGGGTVAAAFLDGVYVSTDRGLVWTKRVDGDIFDIAFATDGSMLVASATQPMRVLVGTESAAPLGTGWPGTGSFSIAVAPTYPAPGSVIAGHASGAAVIRGAYATTAVAVSSVVDDVPRNILRATVTPTADQPAGTSVSYELSVADGEPAWEGPVTPGEVWTFRGSGSSLRWRATLQTTSDVVTPVLRGLTIAYTSEDSVAPPTIASGTPTTTTIRWSWGDRPADATGFVVHAGTHGSADERVIGTVNTREADYLVEEGLTPNTAFCDRHVHTRRNDELSDPSAAFPCVTTLVSVPLLTAAERTSNSVALRFPPEDAPVTYAIHEQISNQFVGADGKLANGVVWQRGVGWGSGVVPVLGLSPDTSYAFCLRARNRAGAMSTCAAPVSVTTIAAAPLGEIAVGAGTRASGGRVRMEIEVHSVGAGSAEDVVVRIPVSEGLRVVPDALRLQGNVLTDTRDGDVGDVDGAGSGGITFRLGTLSSGATRVMELSLTSVSPGAVTATVYPIVSYRPESGADIRTASLPAPLTISIAPPSTDVPPVMTPPGEAPPVSNGGAPAVMNPPAVGGGWGSVDAAGTFTILAPRDGTAVPVGPLSVTGTATPGSVLVIDVDDRRMATVTTDSEGRFSGAVGDGLPLGDHRIAAQLGNARSELHIAVVPSDDAIRITAPVSGTYINVAAVVVAGTAPPGITLQLTQDAAPLGSLTVDESGAFTFPIPAAPSEGPHLITATAALSSGMVLESSTWFRVDRTPPAPPAVDELRLLRRTPAAASDAPTAFAVTLALRGTLTEGEFATLDALLVTVASDPVTFTFTPSTRNWSYETTVPLEPGSHSVRVAARDRAGNVSPLPQALTFDVAPAQCGNGIDDDGDGTIDAPNDPDCRDVRDDKEASDAMLVRAASAVRDSVVTTAVVVQQTTIAAAKSTADTAAAVAVLVQERVLDNPVVEVVTERAVAPVTTVAVVANAATAVEGFQLVSYLQYLISLVLQPGRLLARRKRKAWGTVYASLTKRPVDLATVRLVDTVAGRVVQTAVTDHLGRFTFLVQRPGTYRLEIQHPKFAYPSALLRGRPTDGVFADCYYGAPIVVDTQGAFLAMNVPVDAYEEEQTTKRVLRRHYRELAGALIAQVSLVSSLFVLAVSPSVLTVVLALVNGGLYFLFRRLARRPRLPHSWGAVRDAAKRHPIGRAIVRLFDQEFNKLLETAVTDRYGRYQFLVGKNAYYVAAEKTGYVAARSSVVDLTKQESVLGVDFQLQPSVLGADVSSAELNRHVSPSVQIASTGDTSHGTLAS